MAAVKIDRLNGKGVRRIVYYVCNECNMYHAGKRKPAQCDRCKSEDLEKITINDKEFNYVMKIAMSLGKKN